MLAIRDSSFCSTLLSCALTPQRSVVCWSPTEAKQIPLSDVTQLVAGDTFHCALDTKGKVHCWSSDHCKPAGQGAALWAPEPKLGGVNKLVAGGHTLCQTPLQGPTQCRHQTDPKDKPWTVHATLKAVTGGGCMLLAAGAVRCDLGSPGNGAPPIGRVHFPGAFRDLAEGGFNPGYYGVQHCAIDQAGAVACCKDLLKCQSRTFERKRFASPAMQLVGANTYVAARLDNGDVYAWPSTIRVAAVPFDTEPSGRVKALSKTIEIAGGGDVLCARLANGQVACLGGDFGESQATIVKVPAP